QGKNKTDAIIEASSMRLRPILMTSIATMLGALPIALALGAGSKSRVSMGIVVIGGLMFALVLTLYVIPSVYSYLSGEKKAIPTTSADSMADSEIVVASPGTV